MIFYFSGTGNSEWVAKQIAAGTGDTAVDMADLWKTNHDNIQVNAGQSVGIVFPIHAWNAPKVVAKFAKGLTIAKDAYRYAVCTCGDEAGLAMARFARLFPVDGAWSLMMPNNYIRLFNLDSPELASKKVQQAREKIPAICELVQAKQKAWDVYKGTYAFLKSYIINPLFRLFYMRARGFHAEQECTSCGLCVKTCPTSNIALVEGHPIWGGHCTQCMTCIHRCPVQAIQIGKTTKNKGRYTFKQLE